VEVVAVGRVDRTRGRQLLMAGARTVVVNCPRCGAEVSLYLTQTDVEREWALRVLEARICAKGSHSCAT
jgi:hypothetical protein